MIKIGKFVISKEINENDILYLNKDEVWCRNINAEDLYKKEYQYRYPTAGTDEIKTATVVVSYYKHMKQPGFFKRLKIPFFEMVPYVDYRFKESIGIVKSVAFVLKDSNLKAFNTLPLDHATDLIYKSFSFKVHTIA